MNIKLDVEQLHRIAKNNTSGPWPHEAQAMAVEILESRDRIAEFETERDAWQATALALRDDMREARQTTTPVPDDLSEDARQFIFDWLDGCADACRENDPDVGIFPNYEVADEIDAFRSQMEG